MIFNENKLQEEIIKTWGEFGSHNEVFKAMTLQIKELKEQLILSGVSQQSELLLDFWMNLPKTHKHKGVAQHYIDNYLKSNNCGQR